MRFACTTLLCSVLTLPCRLVLALALKRSSTTFWWPLKQAGFSAVQPFYMAEWMRMTNLPLISYHGKIMNERKVHAFNWLLAQHTTSDGKLGWGLKITKDKLGLQHKIYCSLSYYQMWKLASEKLGSPALAKHEYHCTVRQAIKVLCIQMCT